MLHFKWDYETHTNAERLARAIIAKSQAQSSSEPQAEDESIAPAPTQQEEASRRLTENELVMIRTHSEAVVTLLEERGLYDQAIHEKIVAHEDSLTVLICVLMLGRSEETQGLRLEEHLADILQQTCPDHYCTALYLLKGDEASQRENILNNDNKRKVSELLHNHLNFSAIMYVLADANQHLHLFDQKILDLIYENRAAPVFDKHLAIFAGALHGMHSVEQSFVERIFRLSTTDDVMDFVVHDFSDSYTNNESPESSGLESEISYMHRLMGIEANTLQETRPATLRN